jgi:hypothetical protein
MRDTLHLAGFFAAHAVWCVSTGEVLCPMLGACSLAGDRTLTRFESERYEQAVSDGRAILEANPELAQSQVLVFDGFIKLPTGRTDALVVEARCYTPTPRSFTIAVPYRPASSPFGFAVHRPKVLTWNAPDGPELVLQSFQEGIDSHEEAAPVWSSHLDQSI